MADPKKILGGLGKMGKRLMTADVPGVQYADPLAPASMRMSEALGNAGAEGKTLNFTEADRSRVFGPNRGGVGFSGLQHYSLPHQQANTVWGFGKKSVADVPPDKAMRDFYKAREGRKNKHGEPSPVTYYDLARAEPSQVVDEDYLTFLQKEGYAKGGKVGEDQELKAMIADHLNSTRATLSSLVTPSKSFKSPSSRALYLVSKLRL